MQEYANGELLVEIRNHVAHLTLNRPQALNALSHGMIKGMADLYTRWARDDKVKAIVMRGAGEKAFCAGGDIRALRDSALNGDGLYRNFFIDEYRLDYQLHRYVKPIVCLLDGIVMGGGMGISQGSGFRIVGPKTKMAMPETGIGLFPDVGGSYFLSRSPYGLYLGLTGSVIHAADAIETGLADRYMNSEAITDMLAALDTQQWSTKPAADVAALIERHATPLPPAPLASRKEAIDRHFIGQHSVAQIVESLRVDPEQAALVTLLEKRSPTLLEVTRRQLNRGAKLPLAECFRMELGMVYHCFEHGDLMEGIRAVIIDRDNSPKWQPASLSELKEANVAAFFEARWPADQHPLQNLESLYG